MQNSDLVQRIEQRLAMLEQGSTYVNLVELAADIREAINRPGAVVQTAALQTAGGYVQTVPDHCDRIVWRNHYHHLPLPLSQQTRASREVTRQAQQALNMASFDYALMDGQQRPRDVLQSYILLTGSTE